MDKFIPGKPLAIWFTGLPGSGKSTLSQLLKQQLDRQEVRTKIFDGDIVRKGLNKDLSFTHAGRLENIRRIAEVNNLFLEEDFWVINAFITPREEYRKLAREIIGTQRFVEIYLSTPLETCMERDVKGHYKLAMEGKLPNFTGVTDTYELPQQAEISLDTSTCSPESCIRIILDFLNSRDNL